MGVSKAVTLLGGLCVSVNAMSLSCPDLLSPESREFCSSLLEGVFDLQSISLTNGISGSMCGYKVVANSCNWEEAAGARSFIINLSNISRREKINNQNAQFRCNSEASRFPSLAAGHFYSGAVEARVEGSITEYVTDYESWKQCERYAQDDRECDRYIGYKGAYHCSRKVSKIVSGANATKCGTFSDTTQPLSCKEAWQSDVETLNAIVTPNKFIVELLQDEIDARNAVKTVSDQLDYYRGRLEQFRYPLETWLVVKIALSRLEESSAFDNDDDLEAYLILEEILEKIANNKLPEAEELLNEVDTSAIALDLVARKEMIVLLNETIRPLIDARTTAEINQ